MKDWTKIVDETLLQIPFILSLIGIDMEETGFSKQTLYNAEKVISEEYPFGHEPRMTTLIPFGLLFGETIIRNIPNSEWIKNTKTDNFFDIAVKVHSFENKFEFFVYPFVRIRNFWCVDRADTMSCMFEMLELITSVDIHKDGYLKKNTGDDGWITLDSGTRIRMLQFDLDKSKHSKDSTN